MTRLLRDAAFTCSALLSTQGWAAPEAAPAPVSAPPAEVTIAHGKAGLKLVDTPIFRGQVDAAAWDSAQELIWFTNRSTLNVIDLRDPLRTAVPIAEKMPDGSFAVSGVSTADSGTAYAGLYPVLVFSANPKIDPGSGAYGGDLRRGGPRRPAEGRWRVRRPGDVWQGDDFRSDPVPTRRGEP